MSAPNHAVIEFERATYRIGEARILSEVSFTVSSGETLVLLGRSGSGKTSVLRLINRLADPQSGRVLVEGSPTIDWDPIKLRRRIGYVIQEIGLFPHFTVERNVGLIPALENWPPERIGERVRELAAVVGLDPDIVLSRYPNELSGGQRQRVGVARALAADPPILLMDEPFGALDPITRAEIQTEFRRIQQGLGKAVVFVTHDIREALLLGGRIGVMEAGSLAWIGTPDEFRSSREAAIMPFLEGLA
jgi:osmoprotectant transport system ATP-binding protein